jgi:hypothetical protein
MMGLVLLSSSLLALQAGQPPRTPEDPQKKAPAAAVAVDQGQANAEYNALKEKMPETAAAHWRMAVWCEEHGLKDQAYVHYAQVVQLDPRREPAWRKLGFIKHDGRWMTKEEIVQEDEFKKAEKIWGPRFRKLHKDVHGTNGEKKRETAMKAIDAIKDPAAVLPAYRAFGGGSADDQMILLAILGQVDKPVSSRTIALLAVYGKAPEVRREAIENLRQRPAGDYLDILVGLMIEPFTYEVRRVGGPGSPGELLLGGERYNVRRFYAPPTANIAPQPGDVIFYDELGAPFVSRVFGPNQAMSAAAASIGSPSGTSAPYAGGLLAQYNPYDVAEEAQRGAVKAQEQLERDVNVIKEINDQRKRFNDLVIKVAKDASGLDNGNTPKEWRRALLGGNKVSPAKSPRLTFNEVVPLDYNPVFAPMGIFYRLPLMADS